MSKEVTKEIKTKTKKTKGPKTIIVEEPIKFTGDPLNLSPKEKVIYPDLDLSERAVSRDDIVVERYNPEVSQGLSLPEVEARMMAGFANDTTSGSSKTIANIFVTNIFTFFNFLNFGIAGWLISVQAPFKHLNFLLVVVANLIIGIIQEIKAKKTIDSLSLLSAPTTFVVRDAQEAEISVNSIVIDDILKFNTGKQISADAVIRSGRIEVDESLLTGESDLIVKKEGDPLYSGSFVASGTAYAQAVAVGEDIYVQKLTSTAKKYKKPKSELFISLQRIIKTVGFIILPIAATLFFVMSRNTNLTYQEMVLSTSGAMIGMIPSGLFLLTSSALAVGVIRLAQNNTLVQELSVIEMLARVDVLCLDKTGTITDGSMSVHSVIEFKNDTGVTFKNAIAAMLNAQEESNLTSKALEERFGTTKRYRATDVISFSSVRKYSAVTLNKLGTFILGAPEFVVKDNTTNKDFFKEVEKQAKEGYRVLVVGHTKEDIEDDAIKGIVRPLGLVMIEDTIRPDAIETIQYFKDYGVSIKVISGDNAATVSKISQRTGIAGANKFISLEGLSDSEVIAIANEYNVFGRVSPHQKQVLVKALKDNGHTVAMTGDGVNDILALREADTSIAMASGSEAARNVAHLVLLDSNFSSMPKVVKEGRRVINNIQKLSTIFLTKTIFTILLAIFAIIRKGAYPITPNQLDPINYLVIGIPSFIIAMESNNSKVEGNFLTNVFKGALPGAIVVLINSLIIFGLSGTLGMDYAVTSTMIVLTTTFTMFILLLRVSLPFKPLKFIMFVTMFLIFLILVFFRPDFIDLVPFARLEILPNVNPLTPAQILLLIVLIQAAYPLMYVLNNIVRWSKNVITKVVKSLNTL